MKKRIAFLGIVMLLLVLVIPMASTGAAPQADCEAFSSGSITALTSLNFNFTCAADATVYFGACDSGGVPNDDLFTIVYGGTVVSRNAYHSGLEYVDVGQAQTTAGSNTATLNSTNTTPYPPATYTYAVSSDKATVETYLQTYCGTDYVTGALPSTCQYGPRNVPVFTMDAAPSDGTLEFRIMIGNEDAREVSGLMHSWDIVAGQQINNDMVTNLPSPRYARLYWQPEGESTWYFLPSQYWHGAGTKASEYGISCVPGAMPSYHTSFGSAIPASESW